MSNDLRKRKKDTTPYKTNFRRYKSYVEITCLRVSARISFFGQKRLDAAQAPFIVRTSDALEPRYESKCNVR